MAPELLGLVRRSPYSFILLEAGLHSLPKWENQFTAALAIPSAGAYSGMAVSHVSTKPKVSKVLFNLLTRYLNFKHCFHQENVILSKYIVLYILARQVKLEKNPSVPHQELFEILIRAFAIIVRVNSNVAKLLVSTPPQILDMYKKFPPPPLFSSLVVQLPCLVSVTSRQSIVGHAMPSAFFFSLLRTAGFVPEAGGVGTFRERKGSWFPAYTLKTPCGKIASVQETVLCCSSPWQNRTSCL